MSVLLTIPPRLPFYNFSLSNTLSTIALLDVPELHSFIAIGLSKAYHTRYLGDAAINFIKYLEIKDAEKSAKPIYAKAVSVVQASGSGKSRKLTEVRLSSSHRACDIIVTIVPGRQVYSYARYLSP